MGISVSTMKCPACEGLILETLSTSFGTWERCPNCRGLFVHQDLVGAASQDAAQCKAAFDEATSLLLPNDRVCPKCLQNLYDGRIQSRGVIFALCPTCHSVWTNLKTLGQFEPPIEKKFAAEAETLGVGDDVTDRPTKRPSAFYEDSGLGSLFRGVARMFDRVADAFRTDPMEKELLAEVKAAKKQKKSKTTPPAKLIKSVEPTPPPVIPPVIPPKVQPASAAPPVTPAPPVAPAVPVSPPEPEPAPEAPQIEIPEFIFPEEPVQVLPREPKVEPPPATTPTTPTPPSPTPKPAPAPAAKPIEKQKILSGPAPKPGFFAQLKAAWSPTPKKSAPKPIPSAKPVEPPKPKPVESPKPKPVEPPKPPATQAGGRAPDVWRSAPAPTPKPKPVEPPKPAKAAPAPKPVKVRPPKEPFDHVAFWPPWLVGAIGFMASGLRDYGFEGQAAVLWGVMGWSIGMMLRYVRIYPFGGFQNSTLPALADRKPPGVRGVPVILKGQIVPARDEDPKGPVILKQETRTVELNRLTRRDILPRLFGLANPGQLLKGEVTIKGWYRPGLVPSVEVQEVRTEKTFRTSMARSLRWIFAVVVFAAALVLYLSLD